MKTAFIKKRDKEITLSQPLIDKNVFKKLCSIDSIRITSRYYKKYLDAFNKAFEVLKNNNLNVSSEPKTLIITSAMFKAGPDVFKHYLEQDIGIFIQDEFGEAPRELTKENSGLFPELFDIIILDE